MRTRFARISQRKLAFQGAAYEATWIGTPAVFTTWEGERRVGTITRWSAGYPVAEFPDGTWARLDSTVEVAEVGGTR